MPPVLLLPLLFWATLQQQVAAQCNPGSSKEDTRVRVVDYPGTAGNSCYFPFGYGGLSFTDCDGPYCDGSFCGYWCATSCNYAADYSAWRFCRFLVADLAKPNCAGLANMTKSTEIEVYGGTGSGTACYFPFMYNNVCYDDCIDPASTGEPWCATNEVMYHVSTNQRNCRATKAGLRDASCTSLNSSTPVYLPQQVGTYSTTLVQTDATGNCTFPFYYKEKCYDDCTTVDAQAWDLPWCMTEKYYQPNKRMRVCPHYRKYKEISSLALSWGFFYVREHSSCASSGAACNASWSLPGSSVPVTSAGSSRMVLGSAAEPIELMPQPNGLFILKLPLNCSNANWNSVSLDSSDVSQEPISVEREFWDIRATAKSGIYTVQSMRNATRGMYLSHSSIGSELVLSLSASVTEWRFDSLSDIDMATLGLPCEDPKKLNGSWCAWSEYFVSGSTSTRKRTCACPPALGGLPCEGNSSESFTVVNGNWCQWSAWENLSGGYTSRTRLCNCSAPEYGGADCPGLGNETGLQVNGTWCEWSAYSVGLDGKGVRTRACNCSAPQYGGVECSGAVNETGTAVNGSWCEWSAYSVGTDGQGLRTRSCNCSAAQYGGLDCPGAVNDTGTAVNGSWCAWSAYSVGPDGLGVRSRSCNCSAPQYGGVDCPGAVNETGTAVNGSWCAWSAFNVTGSVGARTRVCNCSAPQFGGTDCTGSATDSGTTVNGTWCTWSAFTVSGGTGTRSRTCNCSAAAYGGVDCPGAGTDSGTSVDGAWCAWSSASASNSTHETRRRSCSCSQAQYGGTDCPGSSVITEPIVEGGWCDWSAWSSVGVRTRSCACPSSSSLGASCTGDGTETGGGDSGTGQAYPAEPGTQGTDLTNLNAYKRLIAWVVTICLGMIGSTAIGFGLMLYHLHRSSPATVRPAQQSSSPSKSTVSVPPIFADYDSNTASPA